MNGNQNSDENENVEVQAKNEKNNNDFSSKTKKCLNRILSRKEQIEDIKTVMNRVGKCLADILDEGYGDEIIIPSKDKNRTWLEGFPVRIEFKQNGLRFYIEFTIVPSDTTGNELNGIIVYGASRAECFSEHVQSLEKNKGHIKRGSFLKRCDGLEDKPLRQLLMARTGLIKMDGESDDEWWIKEIKEDKTKKENNKNCAEFHYKVLNEIWDSALEWVNEKILV